ncbi:hypothetical protein DNJ95_01650 [Stutzerimonas kirkiae]|uniref:Uncharacterized protein n=2 Tax=Stutzerimonas kirkiae TaxID=2211392 RepID=A0A4Q9RFW8_9GAMM|nr:hypothetical protein DNJ96_00980 [Stutzerimonas kirkiae]TBV05817.1 hypothetical protein DNJ95_01650 [Stutzerimonas kirkiae]TBV10666.1 hypothetical protein DNK08_06410 [Stutzerimonas kirkiae]
MGAFVWIGALVGVLLAGSYGIRMGLMEDTRWLALCGDDPGLFACRLRDLLGLAIHLRLAGWLGLAAALLAFVWPGRMGGWLAVVALVFAVPALVLYNATLASFALVLAGLRLVR